MSLFKHCGSFNLRQRRGERRRPCQVDEEAEPAGSDQVVAQLHGQGGGPGLPDNRFTGYILLHQGDYIIKLFLRP